jgi:cardiolipin synthase
MIAVDGEIAFVAGLCIGQMWTGDPQKNIAPWRDTGIQIQGPAVVEVERAFAEIWATTGSPLEEESMLVKTAAPAGQVAMRIIASVPATASMLRLDQLVTALARKRVWLTDAYYAGTTAYAQALIAAAQGGVDVRLLAPNASDIALLKPLSRAGYRGLLEAGVRIFEWNGPMLHAKTAVVDTRWARVGSTNLNIASWLGNCELDAVIEDALFAQQMEAMYLQDLANSTEIVLDARRRLRAPGPLSRGRSTLRKGSGSAGRAAAGTLRIGNTLGAAITGRRTLEPVEARLMITAGGILIALAALFALLPRLLAYPIAVLLGWVALALIYRGITLHRTGKRFQKAVRGRVLSQYNRPEEQPDKF